MMMTIMIHDGVLDKTTGKGEKLRNVVGRKLRREFPPPYDDDDDDDDVHDDYDDDHDDDYGDDDDDHDEYQQSPNYHCS